MQADGSAAGGSKVGEARAHQEGTVRDHRSHARCRRQVVRGGGQGAVLVCERGNTFGYGDLVVDFQNLWRLHDELGFFTVFDASHAAQIPPSHHSVASFGTATGGGEARTFCLLARAAAAAGTDALFIEAHDKPAAAPVERHTQLPLELVPSLLKQVQAIAQAAAENDFTVPSQSPEQSLHCHSSNPSEKPSKDPPKTPKTSPEKRHREESAIEKAWGWE